MVSIPPAAGVAKRPLHLIFLADCSGSMNNQGKIQSLNNAIHEAVPKLREAAVSDSANPNADLLVSAVKFSTRAQWHIEPMPVNAFEWKDLAADGETAMGEALSLVASKFRDPSMPKRGFAPVLVLVSDGNPTDNFNKGLQELLDVAWGQRAIRLAIRIGTDADLSLLRRFIGYPKIDRDVIQADQAREIADKIIWWSMDALSEAQKGQVDAQQQQPPPTLQSQPQQQSAPPQQQPPGDWV